MFASGYETKPALSVPIHVAELANVPPELHLSTSLPPEPPQPAKLTPRSLGCTRVGFAHCQRVLYRAQLFRFPSTATNITAGWAARWTVCPVVLVYRCIAHNLHCTNGWDSLEQISPTMTKQLVIWWSQRSVVLLQRAWQLTVYAASSESCSPSGLPKCSQSEAF